MIPISSNSKSTYCLQTAAALSSVALGAGALVALFHPAICSATTVALPIILTIGSVLSAILFLALTCSPYVMSPKLSEIPRRMPEEEIEKEIEGEGGGGLSSLPEKNIHAEQLIKVLEGFTAKFKNEFKTALGESDFFLLEGAVNRALAESKEEALETKDLFRLRQILDEFKREIDNLREIGRALKEGESVASNKITKTFALLREFFHTFRTREVQEHDYPYLEQLLSEIDINQPLNQFKNTPLIELAVIGAPVEFVPILAKKGANFNAQEEFFGNTALIWAIANAHNSMALELIRCGKQDYDLRDKGEGNTALTLAVAKGYTTMNHSHEQLQVSNLQLVEELLRCGADPNKKTKNGYSPLMIAVLRRDIPMIQALLQGGARLDFDWQRLVEKNYQEVRELLNVQAVVYKLEKPLFESSKQEVVVLLSASSV